MDRAEVLRANSAVLPAPTERAASAAPDLQPVIARIVEARCSIAASRSVLAAVTGIDGCGKGFVTTRLVEELQARGLRRPTVAHHAAHKIFTSCGESCRSAVRTGTAPTEHSTATVILRGLNHAELDGRLPQCALERGSGTMEA